MHSKHAATLQDDCAACHHYRPADKSKSETMPCRSCHKEPFKSAVPGRPGLKAAYHQRCMGCHKEMQKGPTDCQSCHQEKPVDHQELVQLSSNPSPQQVTKECLSCHREQGQDFLHSRHWLWKGPGKYIVDTQNQKEMIGKGNVALNNF